MSAVSKGLQISFVIHAVVYAAVIGGLFHLNQSTGNFNWAGIVAWAWGIGVAAHGAVFVMFGRKK